MSIWKASARKLRHSGISGFLEAAFEKTYREKFLRPLVNRTADLNSQIVSVEEIIEENNNNPADSFLPAVTEFPRKSTFESVESLDKIPQTGTTEQRLYCLQNAVIHSPAGVIQCASGEYIAESMYPVENFRRSTDDRDAGRMSIALSKTTYKHGLFPFLRTHRSSNPKSTAPVRYENAIALMPLWRNYFHWTIECLPRLFWLERYTEKTGSRPLILLPEDTSTWMLESLSMLGFRKGHYALIDVPNVSVDNLLVTSYPRAYPEYQSWLRRRALESISPNGSNSRIYISRKNATKRQVSNEKQVVDALESRGVQSYQLEELSVREQVQLFAEAELVIGPHGAGFANVVYSENPALIELFGSKRLNTYHQLSALLDYEYSAIQCEADGNDLIVDIAEILTVVDHIITNHG